MSSRIRLPIVALVALLCLPGMPAADWQGEPENKLERRAAASVAKFKARMPRTQRFFDEAYGYAILPSVSRFGVGFGLGYGKGLVVEQGRIVGRTRYYQFSSGVTFGVRNLHMIIFFKDREALEYYQQSTLQFMGEASVSFAIYGAAADPAYNSGVKLFTMTRAGVMLDASVSGGKFTFKPPP